MNEQQAIGHLAKSILGETLPLQVCRSANGHYLGTLDEEMGCPNTRESNEYFASYEEAAEALATGEWSQRLSA